MDTLYEQFGQSVKRVRRLRGLSQEQLAEQAMMGRPTIASIERGRQVVALHQALNLSKALGVTLEELTSNSAPSRIRGLAGQLEDTDLEIIQQLLDEDQQ